MAEGSLFRRINNSLTTARQFTFNVIFVLLVVIVVLALFRGCSGATVSGSRALLIDPAGLIVEQASQDPTISELLMGGVVPELLLRELTAAIDHAANDDTIELIVLNLEDVFYLSSTQVEIIGAALQRFKAAGKNVIAYGTYFTQGQYLLASYADELYLHPMGQTLFSGYGSYSLYFKDLLDKINVDVHVFRVGEFKSAVEPFTETEMSQATRTANQALIDNLWNRYAQIVGENRQMSPEAFKQFVDGLADAVARTEGDLALALVEAHLVDELLTLDEFNARITDRVGANEDGLFEAVSIDSYIAEAGLNLPSFGGEVALIVATGAIMMDGAEGETIGASTVREHIREARRNPNVKALVLRVDSPGGSAFASEIIRQELELTQLAGKPVVVSMGDVAASGGYWIAATADRIIAHPATITGSIGVFALIPTFDQALESLGVRQDGVGTTPLSFGQSPAQGLSEPLKQILQTSIEHTYARFTELVARGRQLSPEQVEEIAQGRVWIGSDAQRLGLVDELGGLDRALDVAAELAGLEQYDVLQLETPPDPSAVLLREMLQSRSSFTPAVTGDLLQRLVQLTRLVEQLDDPDRTYALCESCDVRLLQ